MTFFPLKVDALRRFRRCVQVFLLKSATDIMVHRTLHVVCTAACIELYSTYTFVYRYRCSHTYSTADIIGTKYVRSMRTVALIEYNVLVARVA